MEIAVPSEQLDDVMKSLAATDRESSEAAGTVYEQQAPQRVAELAAAPGEGRR